jgi:hypothetical protein
VAKGPGGKDGNADVRTIAGCCFQGKAAQREFADVELGMADGAEENLLRHEEREDRIDAVDLHGTVHERACAIVIPDCNGEVQLWHILSSGQ